MGSLEQDEDLQAAFNLHYTLNRSQRQKSGRRKTSKFTCQTQIAAERLSEAQQGLLKGSSRSESAPRQAGRALRQLIESSETLTQTSNDQQKPCNNSSSAHGEPGTDAVRCTATSAPKQNVNPQKLPQQKSDPQKATEPAKRQQTSAAYKSNIGGSISAPLQNNVDRVDNPECDQQVKHRGQKRKSTPNVDYSNSINTPSPLHTMFQSKQISSWKRIKPIAPCQTKETITLTGKPSLEAAKLGSAVINLQQASLQSKQYSQQHIKQNKRVGQKDRATDDKQGNNSARQAAHNLTHKHPPKPINHPKVSSVQLKHQNSNITNVQPDPSVSQAECNSTKGGQTQPAAGQNSTHRDASTYKVNRTKSDPNTTNQIQLSQQTDQNLQQRDPASKKDVLDQRGCSNSSTPIKEAQQEQELKRDIKISLQQDYIQESVIAARNTRQKAQLQRQLDRVKCFIQGDRWGVEVSREEVVSRRLLLNAMKRVCHPTSCLRQYKANHENVDLIFVNLEGEIASFPRISPGSRIQDDEQLMFQLAAENAVRVYISIQDPRV